MTSDKDKLYINNVALGAMYMFVVEKMFDLKLFSIAKYCFAFIDSEI